MMNNIPKPKIPAPQPYSLPPLDSLAVKRTQFEHELIYWARRFVYNPNDTLSRFNARMWEDVGPDESVCLNDGFSLAPFKGLHGEPLDAKTVYRYWLFLIDFVNFRTPGGEIVRRGNPWTFVMSDDWSRIIGAVFEVMGENGEVVKATIHPLKELKEQWAIKAAELIREGPDKDEELFKLMLAYTLERYGMPCHWLKISHIRFYDEYRRVYQESHNGEDIIELVSGMFRAVVHRAGPIKDTMWTAFENYPWNRESYRNFLTHIFRAEKKRKENIGEYPRPKYRYISRLAMVSGLKRYSGNFPDILSSVVDLLYRPKAIIAIFISSENGKGLESDPILFEVRDGVPFKIYNVSKGEFEGLFNGVNLQ